jgi:hypothetical protein
MSFSLELKSFRQLSSSEVAYKEGPVNLNWGMIMKTVNEDPVEFFKNGGWNFLGQDSDVCIWLQSVLFQRCSNEIFRLRTQKINRIRLVSLNLMIQKKQKNHRTMKASLLRTLLKNLHPTKKSMTLVKVVCGFSKALKILDSI